MFIRKCLDRPPLGKWRSSRLAWKHVFDEEHRWEYVSECASECMRRKNEWRNQQENYWIIIFIQMSPNIRLCIFGSVCFDKGKILTFALSMTFENSPIQTKQCSGVTSRKQSPLLSDDALGSTNLVWTWRRPGQNDVKFSHLYIRNIFAFEKNFICDCCLL